MNWKLLILILVPFIILIPSFVLRFSSVEPFHRGYFCLDTSIQYPYVEHQKIPSYLCLLIWIIISVFHFTMSCITHRSSKMLMQGVYKFIFGFALCLLVTDVTKFSHPPLQIRSTVLTAAKAHKCYNIFTPTSHCVATLPPFIPTSSLS